MNFLRLNNLHTHAHQRRAFIIFVVFVVILMFLNVVTHGAIARYVSKPVSMVFVSGERFDSFMRPIYALVVPKQKLLIEIDNLKNKVEAFELYALNNKVLQEENKQLRLLLNTTAERFPTSTSLEEVRSTIGAFPYGTFLITRAGQNSVKGSYVFTKNSVVLGTISSVNSTTAVVYLFSAPKRIVSVIIGTEENQFSIDIQGYGLGNFRGSVPRDVLVQEGDVVRLSTLPNSIVGVVGKISSKTTDAFKILHIYTPVPLLSIHSVLVKIQ